MNYYNDNDPKACAWLRDLIAAGVLPPGHVDCRSILEVKADDLEGYTQCHFFAGIGGWAIALRWADWPDERAVWTGSCPCQPLSCAGQRKGHADERHLWPAFHDLIAECRPATIFGEQVASKDGREWFAGVRADLEGMGYACGAADLCAAGVGAPHRRQRLYWVADANGGESGNRGLQRSRKHGLVPENSRACRLAHNEREGLEGHAGDVGNRNKSGRVGAKSAGSTPESGCAGGMADTPRRQREQFSRPQGSDVTNGGERPSWSGCRTIVCRDGKARRVPTEPALFPLADGIPGRVGLLRGAGNAIVPEVAEVFVRSFVECSIAKHD